MAANTSPIFVRRAAIQWSAIPAATANTAKDGTGTTYAAFVADATEGSFLYKLRVRALGTNVATVLRVFLNNGSTSATAANNSLITELTMPSTTLSEVAALSEYEVPLNVALPAGYKILVCVGTAIAAGASVIGIGGDY